MAMQVTPASDAAELRRHLDAAPDLVFAAFADPALVRRWLTPNPEVRLDVLSFDFRVGGAYRFAYHVPGGQIMHVNGVFRAIEPPTRLIFSWNIEPPDEHAGIESEVTVTITRDGKGSRLLVRHEKLARAGAGMRHAEGWRGALDQLASLFEAQEFPHET
jgi:uncharacterized protein YndB with AHSA1/START domain